MFNRDVELIFSAKSDITQSAGSARGVKVRAGVNLDLIRDAVSRADRNNQLASDRIKLSASRTLNLTFVRCKSGITEEITGASNRVDSVRGFTGLRVMMPVFLRCFTQRARVSRRMRFFSHVLNF